MKKQIVDKLNAEIPPSQAAYRAGRSTTEHVFAAKVSVEKAVTSANYPIYLLILDMSKAFDTVNRSTLMQELAKVLDPDELHIINVLTNTQLKIWCRKENEWCFWNRYRCPSGWLRERKPLYILSCKSTGQQQTWRPWLHQHHSKTSSTHILMIINMHTSMTRST